MKKISFSEAFGRLLTDGQLRDAFAVDPQKAISSFCDDLSIQGQLINLKIEELEIQAEVLLQKRFDMVKRMLPKLIYRLGTHAWPLFTQYARNRWLQSSADALEFAAFARARDPDKIDLREMNRLYFAVESKKTLRFHLIFGAHFIPNFQILYRLEKARWRELVLTLQF